MTIDKITIKVRRENTGKVYDVEISTNDLIEAIKNAKSTEILWLYIEGWVKGEDQFQAEK